MFISYLVLSDSYQNYIIYIIINYIYNILYRNSTNTFIGTLTHELPRDYHRHLGESSWPSRILGQPPTSLCLAATTCGVTARWSELIWSDPTWLKDDSEKCEKCSPISQISQIFAVGKYLKVPLAGHHTCTTAGWHPASRDFHLGMAERQACPQPVAVTIHTKSLQIVGGTFPVLAM